MIGRVHRTSHWRSWDNCHGSVCTYPVKVCLFFSCRLFCPGNFSIRSHNQNFLNFYWSAAIFLAFWDQLWQICAMMQFKLFFSGCLGITESNCRWCCTMLAIAWSAFLNAVYHDVWLCCISVYVLVAGFSTSISWYTESIKNIWYIFHNFSEVICLSFRVSEVPHKACYLKFLVFRRQAIASCRIESTFFSVIFLALNDFLKCC